MTGPSQQAESGFTFGELVVSLAAAALIIAAAYYWGSFLGDGLIRMVQDLI